MCGIAGVVRIDPGLDLCPQLERMHRAIAHRGPDDRGVWRSPRGHALYAHTRLSVLDPSAAGHQPMQVEDGRFTIVYNGEIFNFASLRKSLIESGVTFQSNSDTEVLLRLYQREGASFVNRLRGMFAFAIWDERDRSCFLARDRFGIKPLYYHEANGVLAFASEVRALVRSGVVAPALDSQAAFEYFRSGSVPEPLTMIKGVRALEAAHHMSWRDGQAVLRPYWKLAFEPAAADGAIARTREALVDSIGHHFVSDVPIGVFLSGGIDSTAIVALAATTQQTRLRTFSVTFPGFEQDEGPEARRTAEHFGTDHHEWPLDAATARTLARDFLAAADQPSIDGFNTFTVSRLARQHGTKVVLSGLGGDELFGGYPSFREVPKLARIGRRVGRAGRLATTAVSLASQFGGEKLRRAEDLITPATDLESAYAVFRGIYSRAEAMALTAHYTGCPDTVVLPVPRGAVVDPTPADTISRLELTRYMRNQLLRDADVMSMASGVELRVPFVDSQLFDTVSRIPAATRLAAGKELLVKAVPEIPDWVARRPKRGFAFPMAEWLGRGLWEELGQLNGPPIVAMKTWYRKWAVLVFERWCEQLAVAHE